ncbi:MULTISPECIES: hypothetical protein [unclassified Sphingomonas]|uniref:hypothetical protein n=1 Tax=unclassified Sphingomonas TaxID=196159 RepID=UPI002269E90B|nr:MULTISPECIES: hypothetical protein [unclassified Sphingomonas]
MPRQLKVYRTPIGFHDAYVAAPSQKAALAAWGSAKDLFARGAAELVTDPALTAAPLATPGVVVKLSRGTAAEQIAALPPSRPKARAAEPVDEAKQAPARRAPAPAPPPMPKPSRQGLEEAEHALVEAEARHRRADRALAAEEAALAKRRKEQDRAAAAERAALEEARDGERRSYDKAMAAWRG